MGKIWETIEYGTTVILPADNSCNLKYRKPNNISVFFHNLSGYDSHLFIKKIASSDKRENIKCIPNNEEKYITFTKTIITGQYTNKKGEVKDKSFDIVFKDSLKFMSSSLEALVNNLSKEDFKNLHEIFTPKQAEILKQKGFYPYEYMDSEEKFNDTKPPPQKAFNSKLLGKGISNKNYNHVLNVWNTFNMKTFKDYHKLYNVTDVLLLADVFENFRDLCLKKLWIGSSILFHGSRVGYGCLYEDNRYTIRIIKQSKYVIIV